MKHLLSFNENLNWFKINKKTQVQKEINNPVLKDFELNSGNCARKSLASLFKEADKCILLCSNCHMEFHNPEYNKQ